MNSPPRLDRNLIRGLFIMAIALAFGLQSLRYSLGELNHPGPGLFPFLVSALLLVIGVVTVVRSRFAERKPLDYSLKNIGIILVSLCGFAAISEHLNMVLGITFMVFFSAIAGTSYSVLRNLKVAAGLIAMAFAFQKLLGLNLPLY